MEDIDIIDLFGARDERAIVESGTKYGRYCSAIASRIVGNSEDAEECVSDTWLAAWNAIPPARPANLRIFLGKIARNIAIVRRREATAQKRGGGLGALPLEELEECITSGKEIDEKLRQEELTAVINDFLAGQPAASRKIFVRRYWYCDPVEDIAKASGLGVSTVKMRLKRMRDRLRDRLEKEGYII